MRDRPATEERMSRRRRRALALVVALLGHAGLVWLLAGSEVEPLRSAAPSRPGLVVERDPIEVELRPSRPPAPAPRAGEAEPEPRPAPPAVPVEPTARPEPAVRADDEQAAPTEPAGAPAPAPKAEPSDDAEPASDWPRFAYGEPPPADAPAPKAQDERGPPDRGAPRRASPAGSLLDRVMTGYGPAPPGEGEVKTALKAAPRWRSPGERAAERIRAWGSHRSAPDDGLRGRRVLAESEHGGYRYVDEDTGLQLPDPPQAKMRGVARKRGTGGQNLGITFEDSDKMRTPSIEGASVDDLRLLDDGGYAYDTPAWSARIFPDGAVRFDGDIASYAPGPGHPMWERLGVPSADLTEGTFDANDVLLRVGGQEPYAAAKQCFLDDTRAIRRRLRERWNEERLEESIAALREHLDELWAAPRPVKERVERIRRLYDDCNEERSGKIARRVILSWARTHLPAGTRL